MLHQKQNNTIKKQVNKQLNNNKQIISWEREMKNNIRLEAVLSQSDTLCSSSSLHTNVCI